MRIGDIKTSKLKIFSDILLFVIRALKKNSILLATLKIFCYITIKVREYPFVSRVYSLDRNERQYCFMAFVLAEGV
jgi:hypothetical protein